ncbi:MAG: putative toxin-antitoxin system toxin component, PIN family [Deltaproteobacteria bacterium]|nr:putative toxin-antitoxin system toxin component, PIN family [Deltaproteobacteria bacterium]
MRIVLDTNVLMAGIFWSGPPFEILKRWKMGVIKLVVSPEIIEEYLRVGEELGQDHPGVDVGPILDLVTTSSEICIPSPLPQQVCRDASDDKFIACALSAQADYIVSGDKDLMVVSGYNGMQVVKPKEFLNLMG